MTTLETKIIELIKNNKYLSDELKTRYILSLFLMETNEQEEYLKLMEAFNYRCHAMERGVYIVKKEEKEKVMKTLEEVKEDILKKINTSH